jgi:hypothetical protein
MAFVLAKKLSIGAGTCSRLVAPIKAVAVIIINLRQRDTLGAVLAFELISSIQTGKMNPNGHSVGPQKKNNGCYVDLASSGWTPTSEDSFDDVAAAKNTAGSKVIKTRAQFEDFGIEFSRMEFSVSGRRCRPASALINKSQNGAIADVCACSFLGLCRVFPRLLDIHNVSQS